MGEPGQRERQGMLLGGPGPPGAAATYLQCPLIAYRSRAHQDGQEGLPVSMGRQSSRSQHAWLAPGASQQDVLLQGHH
jgi:hypothetical protein